MGEYEQQELLRIWREFLADAVGTAWGEVRDTIDLRLAPALSRSPYRTRKPFTRADLDAAVLAVLDGEPPVVFAGFPPMPIKRLSAYLGAFYSTGLQSLSPAGPISYALERPLDSVLEFARDQTVMHTGNTGFGLLLYAQHCVGINHGTTEMNAFMNAYKTVVYNTGRIGPYALQGSKRCILINTGVVESPNPGGVPPESLIAFGCGPLYQKGRYVPTVPPEVLDYVNRPQFVTARTQETYDALKALCDRHLAQYSDAGHEGRYS